MVRHKELVLDILILVGVALAVVFSVLWVQAQAALGDTQATLQRVEAKLQVSEEDLKAASETLKLFEGANKEAEIAAFEEGVYATCFLLNVKKVGPENAISACNKLADDATEKGVYGQGDKYYPGYNLRGMPEQQEVAPNNNPGPVPTPGPVVEPKPGQNNA